MKPRIFISTSQNSADNALFDGLLEHLDLLERRGDVELFHYRKLLPGDRADESARRWIELADAALLLVSASFFADARAQRETEMVLQQRAQRELRVIPVLLRSVSLQRTTLAELEPLPADKKPIAAREDRDQAFMEIVDELSRCLGVPLAFPATKIEEARSAFLKEIVRHAAERLVLAPLEPGSVLLRSVWVTPPLALDPEGREDAPPLVDTLARHDGPSRLAVFGQVGSGKSELLVHTAAELAKRAAQDRSLPLPLLLHARDLADGHERAIQARWPLVAEEATTLLGSDVRWFLLVDGLDEAGKQGRDLLSGLATKLGRRLARTVVTARPSVRSLLWDAEPLWLSNWRPVQIMSFLRQWKSQRPRAVRVVFASPHRDTLGTILMNPLTAALCLLLAESRPDAFASRTVLFDSVVRHFFEAWAGPRLRRLDVEHAWRHVAPVLRTLALDIVRRRAQAISPCDIDRAFAGTPLQDQAYSASQSLENHLGVLARRADGYLDFSLRGLAEFLAGQELLRLGDAEVIEAACELWGEEAARHAIGWAGIGDPVRACALISALLGEGRNHLEEGGEPELAIRSLRPLLVAIRAAGDLKDLDRAVADVLLRRTFDWLLDESSVWAGDRVADAMREVSRARRGTGLHLLKLVAEIPRTSRRDWLASQNWDTREPWISALFERDPSVRAVACDRLRRWVDDSDVRTCLGLAAQDEGFEPGQTPPAIGAGITLRRARRDDAFGDTRALLLTLLKGNSQFPQMAAALALHPGEAEADLLARALRWGPGSGYTVPGEVYTDLAATPEGLRALDEHLPGWPEKAGVAEPPAALLADVPPIRSPSWQVRRRLVKMVAPMLRFAPEEQRWALVDADPWVVVAEVCAMAVEDPRPVLSILDSAPVRRLHLFEDPSALDLGRAAVLHIRVREALLALWDRLKAQDVTDSRQWARGTFPGRALEALVRRGDPDAIKAYAEWLPFSQALSFGTYWDEPLLPSGPAPEAVRAAAVPILENIWIQANEGFVDANGTQLRLSAWTTASVFFSLTPVWRDDPAFVTRLESWIEDGDLEKLGPALWALQRVPLSPRTRERLPERFVELLVAATENPFGAIKLVDVLRAVDRANVATELVDPLRALAAEGDGVRTMAAALLVPLLPEEAKRISAEAAARPDIPVLLDAMTPRLVSRLVEAAPEAWTEALCEVVALGVPYATRWVILFLKALPEPNQARVVQQWARATHALTLPWMQEGGRSVECVRPADRVLEHLFGLGQERLLEEIAREEDEPTADD